MTQVHTTCATYNKSERAKFSPCNFAIDYLRKIAHMEEKYRDTYQHVLCNGLSFHFSLPTTAHTDDTLIH